jgi:hypothetical protein
MIGVMLASGAAATVCAAGQTAPAAPAPATPGAAPAAGQADPAQAQAVLTQLRAALGGDKATALKSLSGEGSSRVTFGDREITNDIQLKVVLPDHFQRVMQQESPNGMPGPRFATTVNGSDAWVAPLDPMPNFGGGPGGGGGGRERGPGGGGGERRSWRPSPERARAR